MGHKCAFERDAFDATVVRCVNPGCGNSMQVFPQTLPRRCHASCKGVPAITRKCSGVSRFVFVLWDPVPGRSDRWTQRTLPEATRTGTWIKGRRGSGISGVSLMKMLNATVYSFGDNISKEMESVGVETIRLKDDCKECNTWGQQWRRKLIAMREALNSCDQVVYMDVDCFLIEGRSVPWDFWIRCAQLAPLQSPLLKQARRHARWRRGAIHQSYKVGGFYIYCREPSLLTMSLDSMAKWEYMWDEHAISHTIDQLTGGRWRGPDEFIRRGFDPPWIQARQKVRYYQEAIFGH